MTGADIHDLLETIAGTSSKLEKQALLKKHKSSVLLQTVIRAALNPLITYGVKKIPEPSYKWTMGKVDLGVHTWKLLNDLATRHLTGLAAQAAIADELDMLNEKSNTLLRRILLKDLRAGFAENTVNKVWPGLIPDTPYMRCALPKNTDLTTWPWTAGVYSQEKADGMFMYAIFKDCEVRFMARSGHIYESVEFDTLAACFLAHIQDDTVTSGEMVVEEDGKDLPREISNGIINHISEGGNLEPGQQVTFRAWDQIPLAEFKPKAKFHERYVHRFNRLHMQLPHFTIPLRVIETRICHSQEEAMEHYREKLAEGKEGTILKHSDGIWKDGTSKENIKFKLEVVVDLHVVGWNEGTGKYKGQIGSLKCVSNCGQVCVDVSARGDAMRATDGNSWVGKIIAVKANALMEPSKLFGDYSLFLPIFVEERKDKIIADTLSQIKDQFANAIKP